MVLKFRMSYKDSGYAVVQPGQIARNYLHGWFAIDLISNFPLDKVLIAATGVPQLEWVKLLRVLRCTRVQRGSASSLGGANSLRVLQVLTGATARAGRARVAAGGPP